MTSRGNLLLLSLAACGEAVAPTTVLPPSGTIAQVAWDSVDRYCIVFTSGDVACHESNYFLYGIRDGAGVPWFNALDWIDGLPRVSQVFIDESVGYALAWDGSLWRFGYDVGPPERVDWPQVGRISKLEGGLWWSHTFPLPPDGDSLVVINEDNDFILGKPGTDVWSRVGEPGQARAFVTEFWPWGREGFFLLRDGSILTREHVVPALPLQLGREPPPVIRRPGAVYGYFAQGDVEVGFVHLDADGQLWRECDDRLENINALIPGAPRITTLLDGAPFFLTETDEAWFFYETNDVCKAQPRRYARYTGLVSWNHKCVISENELRCDFDFEPFRDGEPSYEAQHRAPSITADGQREWP